MDPTDGLVPLVGPGPHGLLDRILKPPSQVVLNQDVGVVGPAGLGQGFLELLGYLLAGLPVHIMPVAVEGVGGAPPSVLALDDGPFPVASLAHLLAPLVGLGDPLLSNRCQGVPSATGERPRGRKDFP